MGQHCILLHNMGRITGNLYFQHHYAILKKKSSKKIPITEESEKYLLQTELYKNQLGSTIRMMKKEHTGYMY